ncbi:MAG: iron-containing alcohol dehydrogenase [Eubacteriales bacterium]|nr:iron-containing alcohol dehydrogenase [Eubacteriales bacterium]
MNYYMPVRLYTGRNCISAHKEELRKLGRKCLIVTGGNSAVRSGALGDVTAVLSELEIDYLQFDKVRSNPTVSGCMESGKQAAEFGADFIIGIGGGSAMDTAKAASVFAANIDLDESEFYSRVWKNRPLPVVLVGTTSGTGSEVTNVSVLVDSKEVKHSIHDELLYSAVSFGDPHYTESLPAGITLSTGVDVLAHCAESFFSKKANSISRAYSAQGISLLYAPLLSAARGENLEYEQREQLYEASILGGLAISVTGTCFPHNVGYFLTENFGVPHGLACAAFFPELISHVKESDPKYTADFFSQIGISEQELLGLISLVMPELDVHLTEDEILAALPRWENNGSVKNTLGTVTTEDIKKYLRKFIDK